MIMKCGKVIKRTALCAMAFSLLLATGCGSKDDKNNGVITVIVKSEDPYWDAVKNGAEEAADELGYKLVFTAPKNEDVPQNSYIEDAVSANSKAILVAPSVTTGLDESLQKAVDAGIPILAIDTDTTFPGKSGLLATDQDAAGGIAARETIKLLPGGGDIAVVGHMQDSPTAIGRFTGYFLNLPHTTDCSLPSAYEDEAALSDDSEAIGSTVFNLVDIQFCDNDADKAIEITKSIVDENPDLKVIYCTNQTSTVGVGRAIDQLGLADKIQVVGFDSSDEEIDFVKSGVLDGIVVQNPYNMGYLGVRYASKAIDGETIPSGIDTGATFVTVDNLENDEVQLLLHPEKF